jgi:hypothetical protein
VDLFDVDEAQRLGGVDVDCDSDDLHEADNVDKLVLGREGHEVSGDCCDLADGTELRAVYGYAEEPDYDDDPDAGEGDVSDADEDAAEAGADEMDDDAMDQQTYLPGDGSDEEEYFID